MKTSDIANWISPNVCDLPPYLGPTTVVPLVADLVVPNPVGMANVPVEEVPGLVITKIRAQWNVETQSFCTAMIALETRGGAPITSNLLRRVPVDKYRHRTVAACILRYLGDDKFLPFRLDELGDLKTRAKNGPDEQNLLDTARIYSVGQLISDSPRKLVADMFGISTRTATNWINLARLEPPIAG